MAPGSEELDSVARNSKQSMSAQRSGGSAERRSQFEAVALPLANSLYRVARRWTGSPEDASDLVQETYLRAYRTFDNFRPGTNSKAWLFTIMRSVFVNEYRKAERQPEEVGLEELEIRFHRCVESANTDPHVQLIDQLNLNWKGSELELALSRLPESFRAAMLLVDMEDLSYEEAAAVLECPVGTLRSRLFRGRKALFVELQAYAKQSGYVKGLK